MFVCKYVYSVFSVRSSQPKTSIRQRTESQRITFFRACTVPGDEVVHVRRYSCFSVLSKNQSNHAFLGLLRQSFEYSAHSLPRPASWLSASGTTQSTLSKKMAASADHLDILDACPGRAPAACRKAKMTSLARIVCALSLAFHFHDPAGFPIVHTYLDACCVCVPRQLTPSSAGQV